MKSKLHILSLLTIMTVSSLSLGAYANAESVSDKRGDTLTTLEKGFKLRSLISLKGIVDEKSPFIDGKLFADKDDEAPETENKPTEVPKQEEPVTQAAEPQVAAPAQAPAQAPAPVTPEPTPSAEPAPQAASANIATQNGFVVSSAKEAVAMTESGGSYTAQNGRYIGRYQLTDSYLGGDYSPENQERVADSYVASRYGSWEAAWQFHLANGWY